jgi:hypothetical protein
MKIDWNLFALFAGPFLAALVGAAISRWWEKRPRLVSYLAHSSAVLVEPPEGPQFQVNTHSIVVRNAGKKAALNVRLTHFVLPNYSVYPLVNYDVRDLPSGGREIVFPVLIPGEEVTVTYLYYPPVFWNNVNSQTRSDEGFAKILSILPAPQPSAVVRRSLLALVFLGSATSLYAIFEVAMYLWRRWSGI